MTVKELILRLKEYSEDLEVSIQCRYDEMNDAPSKDKTLYFDVENNELVL